MKVWLEQLGAFDTLAQAPFAGGGQGQVFDLPNRPDQIAKVYTNPDAKLAAQLQARLKHMISNPPADPCAAQQHTSIAWPVSSLLDQHKKRFLGYVMPRVRQAMSFSDICNPAKRRSWCAGFDYRYLVRTAANLAAAVHAVHQKGYAIGDVNGQNVLVNERALITLIDTDSFQVKVGSECYHCGVGVPDFTPPELHGKDLREQERTAEHDRFGLAVLIYQAIMLGYHPFSGVWTGQDDVHEIRERIARGGWAWSRKPNALIRPAPAAPAIGLLPQDLQMLFAACFDDGHESPNRRPAAKQWQDALNRACSQLSVCSVEPTHTYFSHNAQCPWCASKFDPFPSAAKLSATSSSSAQVALSPATFSPPPASVRPQFKATAPVAKTGTFCPACGKFHDPIPRTCTACGHHLTNIRKKKGRCPSCNSRRWDGSRCSHCHHSAYAPPPKLPAQTFAAPPPAPVRCNSCGTNLPSKGAPCVACASKLAPSTASSGHPCPKCCISTYWNGNFCGACNYSAKAPPQPAATPALGQSTTCLLCGLATLMPSGICTSCAPYAPGAQVAARAATASNPTLPYSSSRSQSSTASHQPSLSILQGVLAVGQSLMQGAAITVCATLAILAGWGATLLAGKFVFASASIIHGFLANSFCLLQIAAALLAFILGLVVSIWTAIPLIVFLVLALVAVVGIAVAMAEEDAPAPAGMLVFLAMGMFIVNERWGSAFCTLFAFDCLIAPIVGGLVCAMLRFRQAPSMPELRLGAASAQVGISLVHAIALGYMQWKGVSDLTMQGIWLPIGAAAITTAAIVIYLCPTRVAVSTYARLHENPCQSTTLGCLFVSFAFNAIAAFSYVRHPNSGQLWKQLLRELAGIEA